MNDSSRIACTLLLLLHVPLLSELGRSQSQSPEFTRYWHQGKAEISRFRLSQSRYGEQRAGHVIMVFVTEDFLPGRQVKQETGDPKKRGAIPILKLNDIRRFTTGIYDYSMMRSVFTPIDRRQHPHSLKTTVSIQEWCGQVWQQLNLRQDSYQLTGHSYFEKAADESREIPLALLEDEIWTTIRLQPHSLPKGKIQVIPGSYHVRLRHQEVSAQAALASLEQAQVQIEGREITHLRYGLAYEKTKRKLAITFEKAFPHRIHSFEEQIRSAEGEVQRSRAVRTHLVLSDYWNKKARRFDALRQELGLDQPLDSEPLRRPRPKNRK